MFACLFSRIVRHPGGYLLHVLGTVGVCSGRRPEYCPNGRKCHSGLMREGALSIRSLDRWPRSGAPGFGRGVSRNIPHVPVRSHLRYNCRKMSFQTPIWNPGSLRPAPNTSGHSDHEHPRIIPPVSGQGCPETSSIRDPTCRTTSGCFTYNHMFAYTIYG